MGIDWGDAPAWTALGVSLAGTAIAMHSARSSRAAARAAEVSAKAGVRQAAAAEEQVAIAREALKLAAEQSAATSTPIRVDSAQEALTREAPYVAWWLDQRGKNTYSLRNIGNDTANDVEIDTARIPCASRVTPHPKSMPPGASRLISLIPSFGAPKPSELWVRWAGHDDWKAVPLP